LVKPEKSDNTDAMRGWNLPLPIRERSEMGIQKEKEQRRNKYSNVGRGRSSPIVKQGIGGPQYMKR